MRSKTMRALLCLALSLSGLACSTRMAAWTAISTRNVRLNEVDLDRVPAVKGVSGRDMKWYVMGIPLGFPRIEGAVDDALRKADGDLITDAVLYSEVEPYLLLIGRQGWRVRGTVVRTRGASPAPPTAVSP